MVLGTMGVPYITLIWCRLGKKKGIQPVTTRSTNNKGSFFCEPDLIWYNSRDYASKHKVKVVAAAAVAIVLRVAALAIHSKTTL